MLVGRGSERQVIAHLLAAARVGRAGSLVLVGEAGIGKSALLADAATDLAGMRLLRASGTEAERDLAFGGLLQLLRPALHLLDRLPGPQAAALGTALALRPGPTADRFAVGAATLTLVCRYAEEAPVAVVVDDAHLLDRPSAESLAFAARRLLADPVAVLAAVRPGTHDALIDSGLPQLVVAGLDRAASGMLVTSQRATPMPDGLLDRLHRSTAGNPLALLELSGDVEQLAGQPPQAPVPVPEALAETFTARTRQLGPGAQAVLLLAAASDGDLAVVTAAATGCGVDVDALAEAERAGLVQVAACTVAFRHPLVRSAVYAAAAADERRAAHAALAAAVPGYDLDRRAWHLAQAALGPDETAARACEQVAVAARGRSGHAVAATAYERSAHLSADDAQRARRLVAAGESALLGGQVERAGMLLARTSPLPPEPGLHARAAALRAAVAARGGSLAEARDVLLAAAEAPDVAADVAVVLLADTVHACLYLGDAGCAALAGQRIERLLPQVAGYRARIVGTMAVGIALVLAGRAGQAWLRRATVQLVTSPALDDDPGRTAWLMYGPLFLREPETGRELVARVVDDLRERVAVGALPLGLFLLARYDATTERWASAEAGYVEAVRLARETDQVADLATALAGLAWLRARQGKGAECRDLAAEAIRTSRERELHMLTAWSLFALGELELSYGDVPAALVHLQRLEDLLRDIGFLDVDLSPAPELADVLVRSGRGSEARAVAESFSARAQGKGQPWALARAARTRGLVGPDGDADEHFSLALQLHDAALDPFERARTQLAYGSRLRRARRRVDARPHLRECVGTFDALGARVWAEAAVGELKATGETARRREAGTVDDLTPQELQVAQMLAAGRTTRQAAGALFLSPKTVEYHLRHVYTKLRISSRGELAAAMRTGT